METIASLRRKAGFTQQQLAAELGVSVTTVASWEQGKYDPSARQLRALCGVFGVQIIDEMELPSDRTAVSSDE